MPELKFKKNSPQLAFYNSTNAIQIMGGGYGNGKSATSYVKGLGLAIDYPGSSGAIVRATRPKLEDTVKPEFMKWTPDDWIAKRPTEKHNDLILKNGTAIHFRHARQEGKAKGENTSNLLSATYDWIIVDQIDDSSFTHKDLLDLMGRLRGTTKYVGSNPDMPKFGPQFMIVTCNPTRNWVFRELVNPVHIFKKTGIVTSKLIYAKDLQKCLIDLYEATTYSNMHNTGESYVRLLESAYKGEMAKRYLLGEWGAYEGLVYPEYDNIKNRVREAELREYIETIVRSGEFAVVEGYDHGIVVPCCYGLGIVDKHQNMYLVDGFYEVGLKIPEMANRIREIRKSWGVMPSDPIDADPAIFKRHASKDNVGETVSTMFADEGIFMRRGNNGIESGVAKISSHLAIQNFHYDAIRGEFGAPHFFANDRLEWFDNEISDYYWNKNIAGDNVDKPRDTNDHAMDMIKYMFTHRPRIGKPYVKPIKQVDKRILHNWNELPETANRTKPRHMH